MISIEQTSLECSPPPLPTFECVDDEPMPEGIPVEVNQRYLSDQSDESTDDLSGIIIIDSNIHYTFTVRHQATEFFLDDGSVEGRGDVLMPCLSA